MSAGSAAPALPTLENPDNALIDWIVRWRYLFFILIAVMLLAGFNGRWRIGRDSSLYREIASNLANGQGYTYRGESQWKHRYPDIHPGLPALLAGVEKVFGRQDPLRPVAALVVMALLAGLTLVTVYHLVREIYPQWLAICVTTGVGINVEFQAHAHGLMTDLPFLLGVCLTMLGVARLSRLGWRGAGWNLPLVAVGVVIAMSMRPTFWALAIAGAGACAVGLLRSRRRRWYVDAIAALLLLLGCWMFMESASGSGGRYAKLLLNHLREVGSAEWWTAARRTTEKHLPESLFGLELVFPLGTLITLELLAASVWLMKRSVLWGLFVIITIGMMLAIGSTPRYFLMILPLLLVQWALLTWWVSSRVRRWRYAPEIMVFLGLAAATGLPMLRSVSFIMEQHGFTRPTVMISPEGRRKIASGEQKPFLEVYRDGKMAHLVALAEQIRKTVPEGQRVLGPEPRILTFLSGREVFHPNEVLAPKEKKPRKEVNARQRLREERIAYAVHGERFMNEKRMRELLARRHLVPRKAAQVKLEGDTMILSPVRIPPPEQKQQEMKQTLEKKRLAWRQRRIAARPADGKPATQPASRPAQPAARPDR